MATRLFMADQNVPSAAKQSGGTTTFRSFHFSSCVDDVATVGSKFHGVILLLKE